MNVSTLGVRIRNGDSAAEEELVKHFQKQIYTTILVRTRNPDIAQDLAQETLSQTIWALREDRLNHHDRLPGYIHAIAVNLVNHYFRTNSISRPCILDPGSPSTALEHLADLEKAALVRNALDRLKPSDAHILRLTLVEGLTPLQIARHLDLKPDVVRKRKSRALKRIRTMIKNRSQSLKGGH